MRECYPILKLNYNRNTYYDNSWLQNFYFEDYYGNLISKNKYKFAKSFNDGYAFVYGYDKNWDIINSIGNSVLKDFSTPTIKAVEMAFKCVSPKDGFFLKNYVVKRNLVISVNIKRLIHQSELFDIKGIPQEINRHGYLLININNPKKMSLVEDYSMSGEGLIAIKHFDKEWIYISIQSFNNHILEKKHFEDTFEFATGFSDGLAKVKKGGLFGFIDVNGEFSIPAIYDDARSFSNGYAAVSIANCRNNIGWNKGVKLYDLAWNFIDKNNDVLFSEPKYNLTRIDNKKNYYFEAKNNIGYTFFWENLDKNYFQAKSLEGLYGWESKSIGRPNRDFWYNSSIIGGFSPSFLVDLLTAQNSDELGFHRWHVACWIAKDRKKSSQNLGYSFSDSVGSADTYIIVKDKKVIAESFYIDFDSTQSELDYILGNNSLEEKYGLDYTEMNWKTKITPPSNSYNSNYDVDWSNYNDSLDMDQQDIDFWNQF